MAPISIDEAGQLPGAPERLPEGSYELHRSGHGHVVVRPGYDPPVRVPADGDHVTCTAAHTTTTFTVAVAGDGRWRWLPKSLAACEQATAWAKTDDAGRRAMFLAEVAALAADGRRERRRTIPVGWLYDTVELLGGQAYPPERSVLLGGRVRPLPGDHGWTWDAGEGGAMRTWRTPPFLSASDAATSLVGWVEDLRRDWASTLADRWAPLAATVDQWAPPEVLVLGTTEQRQARWVGLAELAVLAEVERGTVDQWRHRRLLPEQETTIGGRPAWRYETLERWARETGRSLRPYRSAGRPPMRLLSE